MSHTHRAVVASILVLAACGEAPGEGLAVGEVEQAGYCSSLSCGGNAAQMENFVVFELDEKGVLPEPANGLRIAGFQGPGGVALKLQVDGHRLYGVGPLGGVLQGSALTNAKIFISSPAYVNEWFRVRIAGVSSVPFYDEGTGDTIETYDMVVRREPKPGKPGNVYPEKKLCPKLAPSWDPVGPHGQDVVVYQGDRYDRLTGDVTATGVAAGSWFNLACAGDPRSKDAAIRHIEAAQDDEHQTSPEQREAALRMFRADYCGGGKAYTVFGTPLAFGNVGGWVTPPGPLTPENVEAIWDEGGAVCLNTPRYVDPDEIACIDELDGCTQAHIDSWTSLGHMISINP